MSPAQSLVAVVQIADSVVRPVRAPAPIGVARAVVVLVGVGILVVPGVDRRIVVLVGDAAADGDEPVWPPAGLLRVGEVPATGEVVAERWGCATGELLGRVDAAWEVHAAAASTNATDRVPNNARVRITPPGDAVPPPRTQAPADPVAQPRHPTCCCAGTRGQTLDTSIASTKGTEPNAATCKAPSAVQYRRRKANHQLAGVYR
jgi:hypothetical protein